MLTDNAVAQIQAKAKSYEFQPSLQVVEMTQMPNNRVKMTLSDGDKTIDAVLSQQCQNLLKENKVVPNQIIKLTDYIMSSNVGQTLFTLNAFESGPVFTHQIGSPNQKLAVSSKPRNDYMPIRVLTTLSSDWCIKGRITTKTATKSFNGNRPGKLFSIIIIDNEGTEVEATFFNDAVDMFFDRLQQGKTYTFSGGYVKLASQQYRKVDLDYQISFDKKSVIKEAEDDGEIAEIRLNPVSISELSKLPDKKIIDVIGVITEISGLTDLISKQGDKLVKRTVKIMDQSLSSVEITLWNESATRADLEVDLGSHPVLVGNKLRVSHFDGISLTIDRTISKILIDPAMEAVDSLKSFMQTSQGFESVDLTVKNERKVGTRPIKTLREIKDYWDASDATTREEMYQTRAFIGYIKRDDKSSMTYESCKNKDKCKKKVIMESDGFFKCNSCNESFEKPVPRYLVTLRIHDPTESLYITSFDDTGVQLFKSSAEHLMELHATNEPQFESVVDAPIQKEFIFTIKAQPSNNDRGSRAKFILMGIRDVNKKEAADKMLSEILQILSVN